MRPGSESAVYVAGVGVCRSEVPEPRDRGEARARMMMSRGALLGAVAMTRAIEDAGWEAPGQVGCWMGVGGSGPDMTQLEALLRKSYLEGRLSMAELGGRGLRAVTPLFAFQLMNNFSMCHGAILNGVDGPNGVFYSRGAGTAYALEEGWHAIASGACDFALVGGADDALHPLASEELRREGWLARGITPGEGAAVLALSSRPTGPRVLAGNAGPLLALRDQQRVDRRLVWGATPELQECLGPGEPLDLPACLAATPALAWVEALRDLEGTTRVRTAGLDGHFTEAVFA